MNGDFNAIKRGERHETGLPLQTLVKNSVGWRSFNSFSPFTSDCGCRLSLPPANKHVLLVRDKFHIKQATAWQKKHQEPHIQKECFYLCNSQNSHRLVLESHIAKSSLHSCRKTWPSNYHHERCTIHNAPFKTRMNEDTNLKSYKETPLFLKNLDCLVILAEKMTQENTKDR